MTYLDRTDKTADEVANETAARTKATDDRSETLAETGDGRAELGGCSGAEEAADKSTDEAP
jgi:hypothetical protein